VILKVSERGDFKGKEVEKPKGVLGSKTTQRG